MTDDTRVRISAGGRTVDTTVGRMKALAEGLKPNSRDSAPLDVLNGTAQTQLKTILERIERLEEDKAAIMADLKEVYAEAKGNGFDTKIIRKVVRLRKMDRAKRQEEDALVDLYLSAVEEV